MLERLVLWVGTLSLLLITGCDRGAEWKDARAAVGYRPPGLVTLVVRPGARGEDVEEATQELVDGVAEALHEHGITTVVARAPSPGQPHIAHLIITSWDPGNRGLRWLAGGFGAGWAEVDVVVDLQRPPDGAYVFHGRVRGYLKGGTFGGNALEAARTAGLAIGRAIATGGTPDDE